MVISAEHGGTADLGGGGWSTSSMVYLAFNVSLLDLQTSLYSLRS